MHLLHIDSGGGRLPLVPVAATGGGGGGISNISGSAISEWEHPANPHKHTKNSCPESGEETELAPLAAARVRGGCVR